MSFGGKPQVVYQQSPTAQAAADANKGATDAQKTKKQLEREYGAALSATRPKFSIDSTLTNDTTLAQGSLLGLGSRLG